MAHDRELLIVIATYNEAHSLPLLINRIIAEMPAVRILVIDDNSPDGTGRWCDQFQSSHPLLSVIHRESKLGLGTASIQGLKFAIDRDFRFVATMDADLSHDPAAIPGMLDLMRQPETESLGVVIGSRYVEGGSISGWPCYRKLSSQLVNWYARSVLALPARDNSSAFRIYRVEQLRKIDLDQVHSQGYAYLEEILLLLHRAGIRFAEFPIAFRNRKSGNSKVNWRELARSLGQIFKLSFYSVNTDKK